MTAPLHGLTFGAPLWLWALLTLPLLAGLFFWSEHRSERRLRQLIRAPRLRAQLTGAASTARRRWRYALLLTGLAALMLSMALPRLGYEQRPALRQGLDLILIIDVSKSMLATDVLPSRLARAKLTVLDAVRQLTSDRLGLVAFAGTAFLQAPLTIDYDAVLTATNELDTDLIPRGGTNIGSAIELALEAFGKAEANNRAIILMSDGEPTSDNEQADGIKAAQAAAAAGVKIFTIGFGTPEGSLIPLPDRNGEFVREEDGTLVRSKLNEANLTELAKAAGGFYTHFTNGETTMRAVIQEGLGKVKRGEIDAHDNRKPIERYQWPLSAALLFLAASALIGERRGLRAPAAIGGTSATARAVPVPRRIPGGAATETAAAATVALLLLTASFPPAARAADPTPSTANVSPQTALDLYRNGKYDEAYKVFKELAEKDPKGALQFDAGTSAYKSKQYEEAIQAFGNALATDDPALQAQSQYNFGNTLFRHGQEQKNRETKLSEWRDAIKHYDDALTYLKTHKDDALAKNTEYNRDVVQKYLDEELKEKDKDKDKQQDQQQKKQDQKQDQKQQQQQQNQQQQSKSDQKKQDQQQNQQNQQQQQQQQNQQQQQDQQSGGQSQNGSSGNSSESKSDSQQKNDESKGEGKESPTPQPKPGDKNNDKQQSSKNPDAKQNPTPQPDQSKGNEGQQQNSQPPSDHPTGNAEAGKPNPSDIPNQDKPRQRGEFKAQPSKPDKSQDQNKENPEGAMEDELAQAEPGKMTPGQARALLESLKGEDDRVNLNDRDHRRRDDQVTKDW